HRLSNRGIWFVEHLELAESGCLDIKQRRPRLPDCQFERCGGALALAIGSQHFCRPLLCNWFPQQVSGVAVESVCVVVPPALDQYRSRPGKILIRVACYIFVRGVVVRACVESFGRPGVKMLFNDVYTSNKDERFAGHTSQG